jgi:hypothetical protein
MRVAIFVWPFWGATERVEKGECQGDIKANAGQISCEIEMCCSGRSVVKVDAIKPHFAKHRLEAVRTIIELAELFEVAQPRLRRTYSKCV